MAAIGIATKRWRRGPDAHDSFAAFAIAKGRRPTGATHLMGGNHR
jgi:hypothetical protein